MGDNKRVESKPILLGPLMQLAHDVEGTCDTLCKESFKADLFQGFLIEAHVGDSRSREPVDKVPVPKRRVSPKRTGGG